MHPESQESLQFSDGFAEAHRVLVACFLRLNPKGTLGSAESPSVNWGGHEQAGMWTGSSSVGPLSTHFGLPQGPHNSYFLPLSTKSPQW